MSDDLKAKGNAEDEKNRRAARDLANYYRAIIDERQRQLSAIQSAITEAGHSGTQEEVARLFGLAKEVWRERR